MGSVASFLQTPESQTFKSFTVWQLGEARNHPCETMQHSLNQYMITIVTTLVYSIQNVGFVHDLYSFNKTL